MPKVIAALLGAETLQTGAEQRPERVDRATAGGADDRFQFREAEFDGIEIRAVRREIPERRAGRGDHLVDTGDLVRAEIVGDHDVAGLQRGHQDLFEIGEKARTVDRAVEDRGRGQARDAQRREKRTGLPARTRRVVIDARAGQAATVASE